MPNNLSQMIHGVKMIHHKGINPLNGKIIAPQSQNICSPTKIVMGRETKKMHKEHIVPKFEHFHGAEIMHNNGQSLLFPQHKPMKL